MLAAVQVRLVATQGWSNPEETIDASGAGEFDDIYHS
jgi:hypothetical protein